LFFFNVKNVVAYYIFFIAVVRKTPQLFGRLIQVRGYNIVVLPPQPAGLRTLHRRCFCFFEKICCAFFQSAFGGPNQKRRLVQVLVDKLQG
jgi:hypothetical protein